MRNGGVCITAMATPGLLKSDSEDIMRVKGKKCAQMRTRTV